jgi:hypothetical protein
MQSEDGHCATSGCFDLSPDDPQTSRIMMLPQRVIDAAYEPNCAADGGSISGPTCITNLEFNDLFDWSLSDIVLYNDITTDPARKTLWKVGYTPARTPALTYPNPLINHEVIAGVVNCSLTARGTVFRVGWKLGPNFGGPCINDLVFGGMRCVAGGTNDHLNDFEDDNGNPMPLDVRFKEILCPRQS